jgi:DNA-directed RNA polymerase specialized sigma24 family protein
VERDEEAWSSIYVQYSRLVKDWVRRSSASREVDENVDDLAAQAFAGFWSTIPPEHFSSFPTLSSLLHYLRLCAGNVVMDDARARAQENLLLDNLPLGAQNLTDEAAIAKISRSELWSHVITLLKTEAERILIIESFILGLKPRDIYNRHQNMFASVQDVYNLKRNIVGRLSGNRDLLDLL